MKDGRFERESHSAAGPAGRYRRWLGLALLVTVILSVVLFTVFKPDPDPGPNPNLTVVKGYGGGLKVKYFNDPAVQTRLAEQYGLRVEITKAPSIEALCNMPIEDIDFIWVGDQSSLSIYQTCNGVQKRVENVYNSPIVLYSWAPVVDALIAAGVAQRSPEGVYTVDLPALVSLIREKTTWAQIGLPSFHGDVRIRATDPNRSNSGFQFAGLLAVMLNGGRQVDSISVAPLLPEISSFFLGYLPGTSETFFNQFMTQGMGALPLAVGYESQIIEYYIANPNMRAQVQQEVRMLYPMPTVWASHPFIARTDNGVALLDALLGQDLQRLAWDHHGNRPGVAGISIDIAAIGLPGILPTITSVVDMPGSQVMDIVLDAIASPSSPAPTVPASWTAMPSPSTSPNSS